VSQFLQSILERFDQAVERAVLQRQAPPEYWAWRCILILAVLAAGYGSAIAPLLAGELLFVQLALVAFLSGLKVGFLWTLVTWLFYAWLNPHGLEQVFFGAYFTYGFLIAGVTARKFRETRNHELQMLSSLNLARQVQLSLQPPSQVHCGEITMASSIQSFRELGGDLVCWQPKSDQSGWFFLVGDVMGKGAQAALTAAYVKGLFDEVAQASEDPVELLTRLHSHLARRTVVDSFLSAVCILADTKTGCWLVCRAGFGSPYLRRANGQTVRVEEGGIMLGLPFEPELENFRFDHEPGDQWFIASDGLLEEEDAPDCLLQAMQSGCPSNPEVALEGCVQALLRNHEGSESDDRTAVLLRW